MTDEPDDTAAPLVHSIFTADELRNCIKGIACTDEPDAAFVLVGLDVVLPDIVC